jgi:excisionase family DNA binding protein
VTGRTVTVDAAALSSLIRASTGRPDPAAIAHALTKLATSPATPRPFVSVTEAAHLLGVHPATIRRAAARGDLAHLRVGRRLLIARPTTAAHPSAPERTPC